MYFVKCPICGRENYLSSTEKSRNCDCCGVPQQHRSFHPDDNLRHIEKIHEWGKSLWQNRENLEKQLTAKSLISLETAQPTTVVYSPDQTKQIAVLNQKISQLAAWLEQEVKTKAIKIKQKDSQIQRLTDLSEQQDNKLQDQDKEIQNLCRLNTELTSQLKESQEETLANVLVLRKIQEDIERQLKTRDFLSKDAPIAPESVALEIVSANIADSSENTPPESVSEDTSAASGHVQMSWLPQYNQDPKSMAEYATEVLSTEESLGNSWLARERQVIFEPGNGSYWLLCPDETKQTGYLVPKPNFRFNANNLGSVKICFDFPDYTGNDYSNFSVTAPAIVSKIIPATQQQDQLPQWQLDKRGWLEFRANNSDEGELSYETS